MSDQDARPHPAVAPGEQERTVSGIADTPRPDRHRIEFATTDPDRARAYATGAYDATMCVHSDRDMYRFRHVRFDPGPFYLDTLEHGATIEFRCDPQTSITVAQVHHGVRTDLDLDDRYGPGDLALNADADRPYHVRQEFLVSSLVGIGPQAIAEVAGNRPDDPGPPIRFTALRPTHQAAARRWLRVVDYVTDGLQTAPEFITHPLLLGPMTRLLAASVLTTFPHTGAGMAHPHDRTDATPAALSRAIAYIDANVDLDISLRDIARAARVTVRAVKRAFRIHLDTTPTAYLRRARLDRAHQQLGGAAPSDGTTVTRVAARWGFADPGRFAADYHRAYRQPPRWTLDH
ncbi:helix-turn-helix transcriptional regulator [Krasilnikovia sp. MM14-A1004]|uniref:helix-turn-helix transcriptional regulator n=1 Tax=Krasilnikovia sp. MM14-A1004 TaxID=3373541 RepID=UPI00399D3516